MHSPPNDWLGRAGALSTARASLILDGESAAGDNGGRLRRGKLTMASRALTRTGAAPRADWRAVWRHSMRRAWQLGGAAVLIAALVFLALALVSYTQTDPSGSTAAGDEVRNWMGIAGAWAAERVLLLFG